jgi:PKD repeat protein
VADVVTNTLSGQAVAMTLPAMGAGITVRVVSQPAHGSVGLSGTTATYFPDPGFVGSDSFTFAAYDGAKNSALGTVTISIAQGAFSISATAQVPPNYPSGWPAPFGVIASPMNIPATPTYDWDFGDSSAHSSSQYAMHAYTSPGSYNWTVVSTVQSGGTLANATNNGTIVINSEVKLASGLSGNALSLSWPLTTANCLLEESQSLGANAHWTVVTNATYYGGSYWITVPTAGTNNYYRLRKL